MKETIRTYYARLMVDTLHTETTIKAYSKPDAKTLLDKLYTNCKVTILDIDEVLEKNADETGNMKP